MTGLCTTPEVVAAAQHVHALLQRCKALFNDKVAESSNALQIEIFAKKLEAKLPVLRDTVIGSRPSALCFGLLLTNLDRAAEFLKCELNTGDFVLGSGLGFFEQDLLRIQEGLFYSYQIALLVTALDVGLVSKGGDAMFLEGLALLELRVVEPRSGHACVEHTSSAQRLSALRYVLQPGLDIRTCKRIEEAAKGTCSGDFLDDVLATVNGASRSHEQKFSTPPQWYQDPLTWETLVDPVKCNDGRTYDRWTIIDHNVTRGPYDNRDPFSIICDDVDVRGRLFEMFPEQEASYLTRRREYRDEAARKVDQMEYEEAISMLENVLKWAESDSCCTKLLVSARCALQEQKSRGGSSLTLLKDLDEPSLAGMLYRDMEENAQMCQISGELQSWMGWYRSDSLSLNMYLEMFVTSQNRLYGHGSDASGDWIMEGHCSGDDVKFRVQYVYQRDKQVLYIGKRHLKTNGTEYMEGDQSRLSDSNQKKGGFHLERVLSSPKAGRAQQWAGSWEQDETMMDLNTEGSDIVFTSHNKLFGSGKDNLGRFMYLGTYAQEGNRVKVAFLKLYDHPQRDSTCLLYWGQLFKGLSGVPTVLEGIFGGVGHNAHGRFRLATRGFPGVFPGPLSSNRLSPRIPGVLESWKGWHEQDGLKRSLTAALYLTNRNRLCGYGSDAGGQWTWEGEYVGNHQVSLHKQYINKRGYRVRYFGTKCFNEEGKEVLEGTWSNLTSHGRVDGKFSLQRETSSMNTAYGQLWTGYWQFSSGRRGTDDTEFVFTSHNKMFGFGSDMEGSFTHTGTYAQEGNTLKITTLKVYEPNTSPCVMYWGQLYIRFQASTLMEGKWLNVAPGPDPGNGIFRLETRDFCAELCPSVSSCVPLPLSVTELEVWKGGYQQDGRFLEMTAELYVTSSNRLCGFGRDSSGEWTWEGDADGNQLELRTQYLDRPQSRVLYKGVRSILNDVEVIEGHWQVNANAPRRNPQAFRLEIDKAAGRKGYGQQWTGYCEMSTDSNKRGSNDSDFVFTNNNRILGFGCDVEGTYTYLGSYTREPYYTLRIKMVKVYEPGKSASVHYCGQIDLRCLESSTRVMEGSWASVDGRGHGTFAFQTQDFDVETFISLAGPVPRQ